MNEFKSKGFILRTIQTQEADLIVRILAQNGEKFSFYARAALKSKKRFEGSLRILNQVEFRGTKKASKELWILEDTRITHEFKNLSKSIESLAMASYLAELTDHCAHEGLENPKLYNLFGAGLKALDKGASYLAVCAAFEAKLLMIMGWQPDLESLELQQKETVHQLLKEKFSELSVPDTEVKKLKNQLKERLLSHIGHGKLKSIQFLNSI